MNSISRLPGGMPSQPAGTTRTVSTFQHSSGDAYHIEKSILDRLHNDRLRQIEQQPRRQLTEAEVRRYNDPATNPLVKMLMGNPQTPKSE